MNMNKIPLLVFTILALSTVSCGTTNSTKDVLADGIEAHKYKEVLKKLLNPIYAYGVSAYHYKKENNSWPKDSQSLTNQIKSSFPKLNLEKVTITSILTLKNNSFEIKSVLTAHEKIAIHLKSLINTDINNELLMSMAIDKVEFKKNEKSKNNNILIYIGKLAIAAVLTGITGQKTDIPFGIQEHPVDNQKLKKKLGKELKDLLFNK